MVLYTCCYYLANTIVDNCSHPSYMDIAQEVEADCPCTATVVIIINYCDPDDGDGYFKSAAMEFTCSEIKNEFESVDDDDSNSSTLKQV